MCPNDLILGRATSAAPAGPWSENKSIIDLFWEKWTLYYFPRLIMQQKWHYDERNLKVGDIVIIVDKKLPRGQWKLGKVSAVEPGVDDKVRKVSVQYKNKSINSLITIERAVQRLVVILPIEEQN